MTSSPRLAPYSSSVPSSISGAPLFHGRQVPSRVQSPAPQAGDSQSTASPISQSGNRHPSISVYSSSDHSPSSSPPASLASQAVRNSSPAPTTSSISSHNTSIFQTEDEELSELSQLADVLSVRCFSNVRATSNFLSAHQSIPLPVSRDDAFHSLGAATAKKKTVKLERDLAHALLREARMYTKILHMKAKWADKRLLTADVHISRINLVIKQSGHNELLLPQAHTQAHKSLSPESMPVFFEGGLCRAASLVLKLIHYNFQTSVLSMLSTARCQFIWTSTAIVTCDRYQVYIIVPRSFHLLSDSALYSY